jgi:isorenieratene synthase
VTPADDVVLAGDFVRLETPSALMERAVMSGMLAANHVLARRGLACEPIATVRRRGIFAGLGGWV